jgi:hypothetical protein
MAVRQGLLIPDARRLKRSFAAYVAALAAGKFSRAIAPRKELIVGGIEVWFRPRRGLEIGRRPGRKWDGAASCQARGPSMVSPPVVHTAGGDRHQEGVDADAKS